MPSQIASPIPISASRRNLALVTSQDLFASINATLNSKTGQLVTPNHTIRENDYAVPAPPPPSPVSYGGHWPASLRR
ncbi:hypothetical protein B0T19DRAFT_422628 [Cercophora scortea]|uniref:Uncharacterized protein n=1 Tax=Cercophora scortea TaxID=314031 RepID=A0AAE0IMI5_9PEZI|nr:hypothetical protein B0T19DRAFT_422628 [Cercophora scortea]